MRRRIKKQLPVLAVLAAAGETLVGLVALNRSMNNDSENVNTDIEWVNYPHRRAIDGAWVQGYWRTKENGTILDNFSTQGKINPFTGKPGWVRMP